MRPGGGGNEAYEASIPEVLQDLAVVLSTVLTTQIPFIPTSLHGGVEQKLCHTPFLERIDPARRVFPAEIAGFGPIFSPGDSFNG